MFMMLIIAAVLMILLGFIGIYVGYIFQEVKHRPVFVIKEKKVHPNNQRTIRRGKFMKFLVTGGAGYIGRQSFLLEDAGHQAVILDSLLPAE